MASPSKVSTCNSCDRTFTHSTFFPTATRSGELLQILRTNCAPRDSSEIRAIVSAISAELARYTKEIDRLDDIFQELYAASEALQQLYDQCVAIADSPVRRLQTELLGEIFSHCVEPKPASSSEPTPAGSWEYEAEKELRSVAGGNIVPLSQVCGRWRGVIIGKPTLWSTIKLDLRCWTLPVDTMRGSLLHRQMIHLLHVALERSQQAPLTVEVIGVGECHPAALQALALVSCRWHSATFVLNPAMLQNLSAAAGNLPLLEGLSINADEDGETLTDVVKYFSHAPKLRGVGFVGSLAGVGHLPQFIGGDGATGKRRGIVRPYRFSSSPRDAAT
ncbi:hypothetical protein DFH09DRAFT_1037808 [Mycena vulgaris]|nr:hypothetical protein DFH09DRAFT_1037808 [Mycena vulgaris]